MPDQDTSTILQTELAALSENMTRELSCGDALPEKLHYPVDGQGALDFIMSRSLTAVHSRFAPLAVSLDYAAQRLQVFLDSRLARAASGPAREFCRTVADNRHPESPSASCFVARLYEQPGTASAPLGANASYSFILRTASLPLVRPGGHTGRMFVQRTLCDPHEQDAWLARLYDAYEAHYLSRLEQVGPGVQRELLFRCWSMLRRDTIDLLLRFRPPAQATLREWVVTALDDRPWEEQSNEGIRYRLVDEVFVPCFDISVAAVDAPVSKTAIEGVVIHRQLPYAEARAGLQAVLGAHRMFALRIEPQA